MSAGEGGEGADAGQAVEGLLAQREATGTHLLVSSIMPGPGPSSWRLPVLPLLWVLAA